jgi:mRNA-degrading endonuclease toxin of MazEF toxin-antitoxin module
VPRRGDNFQTASYVPLLGDVVHVDWSPAVGHEMAGPHYGLVMSADLFNQSTGLVLAAPITSKGGKLSGFEIPIQVGRVSGVIVISALRSLDYLRRDIQYEAKANPALVAEANRRLRIIFP